MLTVFRYFLFHCCVILQLKRTVVLFLMSRLNVIIKLTGWKGMANQQDTRQQTVDQRCMFENKKKLRRTSRVKNEPWCLEVSTLYKKKLWLKKYANTPEMQGNPFLCVYVLRQKLQFILLLYWISWVTIRLKSSEQIQYCGWISFPAAKNKGCV